MKPAREPASSRPNPCASLKKPHEFARSPLLVALVGSQMTVVRHQLFPQKPPGSSLWFSRTGVQPSPGSLTVELPSDFAESGAYPPDRALPVHVTDRGVTFLVNINCTILRRYFQHAHFIPIVVVGKRGAY